MPYPRISTSDLKAVRTLSRKSARSESGLFLVEGPTLIAEAIQAGWEIQRILVVMSAVEGHDAFVPLLRHATASRIEILQLTSKDMSYISATEHSQGLLAVARQRTFGITDIPDSARIVVALDHLQDPGNVGTCIRSADWFGAAGVILGAGCASVYNDKTVRASAGSLFHLPCIEAADLPDILRQMRAEGYHVIGADANAPHLYTELSDMKKVVLVLGSEASGFSSDVERNIESLVCIPRHGRGESLNVSIAGSIILAHLAQYHGSGEL